MAPLILALAACAACAARAGAETAPATSSSSARSTPQREKADEPPAAETRTGDAAAASPTAAPPSAAAPTTQQKVARALDPEPGGDVCTGYAFDGVALGMSRTALQSSLPLVPLARGDALIEGFEERTYAFRAARPGRIDDVQVGFSTGTPAVMQIRAQILVAEDDAWPRILFDKLGKPKNARISEWIWWDLSCGATLRLTKVEALGEASGSSYTLEVRHTLKPAE